MEDQNQNTPAPVLLSQQEKIKLKKNLKGYVWEISLLGKIENNLRRLKAIDSDLKKEYGET